MGSVQRPSGFVETSPRFWARLAGFFYLVNTVTSLTAFSGKVSGWVLTTCNWTATVSYVAVTALLYFLLRPVSRNLSLIAALFGLAGSANEVLWRYDLFPFHIHSLVYFGFYCTLLGVLILRSTFMPSLLGAILLLSGAGWLTFVSPRLAALCTPYNYIAGGVGEIPLMLWLLILGVNSERWMEQAHAAK
jgi:Domain of unknown function (DUF4386)